MRSAGQVSADLPRHISSWTPAAYQQSRGSHEQEVEREEEGGVREAHDRHQPACCRRPPNRPEEIRGLASLVGPSSFFVVLLWEEEKEEEEEQEEAFQVLFWCADTALCAQVPLSLFFSRCVPSLRPLVSGSLLFAVLLGSTVDTCYVSLQRLLWLSSSTWRSSLQSSIFAWTVWHVVNYTVLGTDSQAIRGLYASVQFSDKVVFLPGVGQ